MVNPNTMQLYKKNEDILLIWVKLKRQKKDTICVDKEGRRIYVYLHISVTSCLQAKGMNDGATGGFSSKL